LIFDGSSVVAEAHLDASGGAPPVTAVAHGPATDGIVNAIAVAERLPVVNDHEFEPRLLLIPSLTFVALWLHSDVVEDIVIPIPPSAGVLANLAPTTPSAVTAAMSVAVQQLRTQLAAAPGASGGVGGDGRSFSDTLPESLRLVELDLGVPATDKRTLAAGGARRGPLPPFVQYQQQPNWCWAAVGTSVGLLLNTGAWTQCDTAKGCLNRPCCSAAASCNVFGYLDAALNYSKSLVSWGPGTAPMTQLQSELAAGRPVCTRVSWHGSGTGHFMVISGCDGRTIWIQDPIYGMCSMAYVDYPRAYQGGASWTHTYYCGTAGL
jgi:hypothetical protein